MDKFFAEVKPCTDAKDLALTAAKTFADQFKIALKQSGRMSVALSGGTTPLRTYELLAGEPFRSEIDWSQVHVFWGDERCVPLSHSQSNYCEANNTLLSKVPIPRNQIHPMFVGHAPNVSVTEYENLLKLHFGSSHPAFDMIFLGLGEDGHTASLFPDSQLLNEKRKWVCETQKSNESFARMTMTLPILNFARFTLFLVSGSEKSQTLNHILKRDSQSEAYPARYIKPVDGELLWLVDSAAYRTDVH